MAYFNKRYHPPGTPPGTLTTALEASSFTLTALDYIGSDVRECRPKSLDECRTFLHTERPTWIHVQGTVSPEALQEIGELFGLHPLALEDVLNTGQRPKMDVYEDQLFVVMGMPTFHDHTVLVEQFSAFLGKTFLVTFHNGPQDPFEAVRKHMHIPGNRLTLHGADYLLYTLLDMVIDQGFPLLEDFGEKMQDLEEQVLANPTSDVMQRIHLLRRALLQLRRTLWPLRELVNALLREESELLGRETRIYLRDCYDHSVQIMDLLEAYRDVLASMLDVYYSSLSNRMNEIMRLLTLIATIFIPLTFVAGVYGMNFEHPQSPWAMPELHWYYGYPLVLLLMFTVGGAMLFYFRRKHWL
jgi:magnesium transporter